MKIYQVVIQTKELDPKTIPKGKSDSVDSRGKITANSHMEAIEIFVDRLKLLKEKM